MFVWWLFYIFLSDVFPRFRPLASQISACKVATEIWSFGSLTQRPSRPPPFISIKADDCLATSSLAFPLLATNLLSDTLWIVWLFCVQQVYWWRTVPEEYYSHCPTAYQNNFIPLLAWDVSQKKKKSILLGKLLWVYLMKRELPCEFCWCFCVPSVAKYRRGSPQDSVFLFTITSQRSQVAKEHSSPGGQEDVQPALNLPLLLIKPFKSHCCLQ